MSLNLSNKKAVVAQVSQALTHAQTIILATYTHVPVATMTISRAQARKANVYLHIIKNTLARLAVADTDFAPLGVKMRGQVIYSISNDPIAATKVIYDLAKANDKVTIIAGMYNKQLLDAEAIKRLALIPSRDELLAMLLGVMQQIPASVVRCIAALRDKKEQEAA